ncbi:MAG: trypsin-like peptidase domain-containing protein [Pseudomonadota bacterium]
MAIALLFVSNAIGQSVPKKSQASLDDGLISARVMMSAEEQADFGAVGQLRRLNGGNHCTAVLVTPELVLTAAHCVADNTKKWRSDPGVLKFYAQWRDGFSPMRRGIDSFSLGFQYMQSGSPAVDIALLRLTEPIDPSVIAPIPVVEIDDMARRRLTTMSFGYDAADGLSRQDGCRAVRGTERIYVTNCEAVGGMSGSPVLVENQRGQFRVAAIVARRVMTETVSTGGDNYGSAIVVGIDELRLDLLRARLPNIPKG